MSGGKADRQERQERRRDRDFANLLSGRMQLEQSTGQKQVKEDDGPSNKELAELTQYLQLEDITEIENGTEIFQQMLSNNEMDKIGVIKTTFKPIRSRFAFVTILLFGRNKFGTSRKGKPAERSWGLIEGLSLMLSSLGDNNYSFIQTQSAENEQKLVSSLYSFLKV